MEKRIITYHEYGKLVTSLVQQIIDARWIHIVPIKYVYGVPKGGLPIAVHLAHYLNLEYIGDPDCYPKETMIADDIADTGITLKEFGDRVTATLFYKERSSVEPNFYVEKTDKWIVFPWERLDEIPNRPE